jgi:hypothetical protein
MEWSLLSVLRLWHFRLMRLCIDDARALSLNSGQVKETDAVIFVFVSYTFPLKIYAHTRLCGVSSKGSALLSCELMRSFGVLLLQNKQQRAFKLKSVHQ